MLLLMLACAGGETTHQDPGTLFYDADAPGPFFAGALSTSAEGPDGLMLPLEVWFPSEQAGTQVHSYDGLVPSPTATSDAKPACDVPRPVVMFSHGNSGVRFQSWFFTEMLASHGYMVAAPDHVGNTAFDDGDVPLAEMAIRRPRDIMASFDALVEMSQTPGHKLEGCVDPEAGYAMAGHSFGGYTTLVVSGASPDLDASASWCEDNGGWLCGAVTLWQDEHPGEAFPELSDPRVWAAIPMSPAGFELLVGGLPDIAVPIAVLSGHEDDLTPWDSMVHPIYQQLAGTPRSLGGVYGAGHYSFSNACELLPIYDDCDPPYLPPAEVHAHANQMALAVLGMARGFDEAAAWVPASDDVVSWEGVE